MKKGDLRRGQIIDAAEALFFEQGYDRTSVQDILNRLNISKGGFYHYFDAKETVLREICERRWLGQFDKLKVELFSGRRSPMDKLNLLLRQANLFEAEDIHFAALMLKVCYRDHDATMRDYRRRILTDNLTESVRDALTEGFSQGTLHARHPLETGRLLLLLACDVNDEACDLLAAQTESPDRMIKMIELVNAYRESVELLSGAPYGTIQLFDVNTMVTDWIQATEELTRLEQGTL